MDSQAPCSGLKLPITEQGQRKKFLVLHLIVVSFMAESNRLTQISGQYNVEMFQLLLLDFKDEKDEKVGKNYILRKMFPVFFSERNNFIPLLFL